MSVDVTFRIHVTDGTMVAESELKDKFAQLPELLAADEDQVGKLLIKGSADEPDARATAISDTL